MGNFEFTNEILKNLKKIYKLTNDIMNLTKDMEDAMITEEDILFGKILERRGDIMLEIDQLKAQNKNIIKKLPDELSKKIDSIVNPLKNSAVTVKLDNPLETNIYDTNKSISDLLKKIIVLDNSIQSRIKGGINRQA